MKRRIKTSAMVLLAVVLLGTAAAIFLVPRHQRGIEDWLGSQLQGIANSYLNPKLTFTDLTYEYPRGVSLKHLRLTADDPAHPGKTIDIIAAERAAISLAEIPSYGKPIIIEKITLVQPLISAVAVSPRSQNFIGFSNLVRGTPTSSPANDKPAQSAGKLSDVFRMRLVQIDDGKVIYDPRIPGTAPMMLDKINTSLNITRSDGAWYTLDTTITRTPVLDLQLHGQINLDTFAGRDLDVKLAADLGQDKLDYLPPELQAFLKQYEATGKLSLEVTGELPFIDPTKGKGHATLKLDHANIAMNGLRVPVDNLDLNAKFENGTVIVPSLTIAALGGLVDISGSTTLNDRMDTDVHLKIVGARPERLLANQALASGADPRVDLDFNIAGPMMSLFAQIPAKTGEPLATIGVKDFRISANDPENKGQTLDLLACKNLDVVMTEPIVPGKPIVIDKIVLNKPLVSAIAVTPGSSRFVGMPHFAASGPSASGQSSNSTVRLSDIIRIRSLQVKGAKFTYDSRNPGIDPLVLDPINASFNYCDPRTAQGQDVYNFDTGFSANADLNLHVAGRIDLDTMIADPLKVNATVAFGGKFTKSLPLQVQQAIGQFQPAGSVTITADGMVPFFDPASTDVRGELKLDDVKLTAGNYRIPLKYVHLPMRYRPGQIEFLDSAAADGPTIQTLGGTAKITGTMALNQRLDSTLQIGIDGMLLQSLMADQIDGPKKDLTGEIHAELHLANAPLHTIIEDVSATTPPGSPDELPARWGSTKIEMTHARLTGFAVIQGMTRLAKSAFATLFKPAGGNVQAAPLHPTESAKATIGFEKDHLNIGSLHYEGEDIAADGKGYMTLAQELNMDITGGPMSKLGHLGSVGKWLESASDSLLYYHVCGTLENPNVEARRGDAQPIVQGTENLAGQAVKDIGKGLEKAGTIINGLFNRGDQK